MVRQFNAIALRTAKTLWSFGHIECNRVNEVITSTTFLQQRKAIQQALAFPIENTVYSGYLKH